MHYPIKHKINSLSPFFASILKTEMQVFEPKRKKSKKRQKRSHTDHRQRTDKEMKEKQKIALKANSELFSSKSKNKMLCVKTLISKLRKDESTAAFSIRFFFKFLIIFKLRVLLILRFYQILNCTRYLVQGVLFIGVFLLNWHTCCI